MTSDVVDRAAHPAAVLLRSPAVWLGVAVGLTELADLGPFDRSGPITWIPPLLALSYLGFAVFRHGTRRPGVLAVQAAGVVGFTALTLLALVVDPAVGRYLVAAAWLAHAGWDVAHRDGQVAPTWYVRFCVPLDLLVALALVLGGLS